MQLKPSARIRIFFSGKPFEEAQPLEANPYWNFEAKNVLSAMVIE